MGNPVNDPTVPDFKLDTIEDAIHLWKVTLGEIELQMTKATFNTWLRDARLIGFDPSVPKITIGLRNDYAVDWVANRMNTTIVRVLSALTQKRIDIDYVVNVDEDPVVETAVPPASIDHAIDLDLAATWKDFAITYADIQNGLTKRDCIKSFSRVELVPGKTSGRVCIEGKRTDVAQLWRIGHDWPQHFNRITSLILETPAFIQENGHSNGNGRNPDRSGLNTQDDLSDAPVDTKFTIESRRGHPVGGYFTVPHYVIRFWKPYLGRAYDLWELFCSHQFFVVRYKEPWLELSVIMDALGVKEKRVIIGREATKSKPASEGWLNRLVREGILRYEIKERPIPGDGRRKRQVVMVTDLANFDDDFMVPTLTFHQVKQLPDALQAYHAQYLEYYRRSDNFDYDAWFKDSALSNMPGHSLDQS